MSYYKTIDGIRYDRRLLDAADAFTQGRGEYRISLEEMQELYAQASDGQGITATEHQTLQYIATHYPLTEKAKTWWLEQQAPTADPVDTAINEVLRIANGLNHLHIAFTATEVNACLQAGGTRTLESVLQGVVDAFLQSNQGQLSLAACVARRDLAYNDAADQAAMLRSYINKGALYLVPLDINTNISMPYDLPEGMDTANGWVFVLQTPDFSPVEFSAFVHKDQAFQYSKGQFSKKADTGTIISAAARQFTRLDRINWFISYEELEKQMALLPGQNFGNAFFAILNAGIYNQESSSSFGDYLRQEIWPDPEASISETMREYANSGTIHLIPLDYREQTNAGTADFPVPPQFTLQTDYAWYFGLEMPEKTNVRLLLNAPRANNDGNTAWNDGFIDDHLSAEARLEKIAAEEFEVNGLLINIDIDEYEAQKEEPGPDWRHLPGLFRQALNTILHDYISTNGVFNFTARHKNTGINLTDFDDPKEYRAAISHHIKTFMRTDAQISFMPNNPEDTYIPNGETVAENWVFRAVFENLADHYFWIVIPRRPEDEQRPYNYIS